MLIAFIGPPCSGKTTTAARLFADLKDAGYPAEFLPEHARRYIAQRRLRGITEPLNDEDQLHIMGSQEAEEKLMKLSSPDSVCVADSSAINAFLYMTKDFRDNLLIKRDVYEAAQRYSLIFRCSPVRPGSLYDPNRVHSFDESVALDELVNPLLSHLVDLDRVVHLFGPQKMRAQKAYGAVLEAIVQEQVKKA